MSWTLGAIASEARRNVFADRGRTIAHAASWTLIIAAVVAGEMSTMNGLSQINRDRDSDGINVAISTTDSGIEATSCAQLDQQAYVRAAGGLTETGIASIENLPDTEFVAAVTTNRTLQVLDPNIDTSYFGETGGVVYVGNALAGELGLSPGEVIPYNGHNVTVGAVLATSPRTESVDRWLLTTDAPLGTVGECWVEYRPSAAANGLALNSATLVSTGDSPLESHELFRLDERSRNLANEFQQRQLATGWPAIAALGLLITAGTLWSRRAELALYRTVGLSTTKMMLLVQLEAAITLAIATILGTILATALLPLASSTVANTYTLDQLAIAARTIALIVCAAFAATPLLVSLLGRNTMALLKDR